MRLMKHNRHYKGQGNCIYRSAGSGHTHTDMHSDLFIDDNFLMMTKF